MPCRACSVDQAVELAASPFYGNRSSALNQLCCYAGSHWLILQKYQRRPVSGHSTAFAVAFLPPLVAAYKAADKPETDAYNILGHGQLY